MGRGFSRGATDWVRPKITTKRFSPMNDIPNSAHLAIHQHLELIDAMLPGRCLAYFLVGSIALGDFQENQSDIDFVIVLDSTQSLETQETLKNIHHLLVGKYRLPKFDGIYITPSQLAEAPNGQFVPYWLENKFFAKDAFAANPITWLTIAQHRCAVRDDPSLVVYTNLAEVKQWCMANMDGYWAAWLRKATHHPVAGLAMLWPITVQWGVLGITRLWATIESGRIISKSQAADYAKREFGEWSGLLDWAFETRNGRPRRYKNPFSRRREALGFMQQVMCRTQQR